MTVNTGLGCPPPSCWEEGLNGILEGLGDCNSCIDTGSASVTSIAAMDSLFAGCGGVQGAGGSWSCPSSNPNQVVAQNGIVVQCPTGQVPDVSGKYCDYLPTPAPATPVATPIVSQGGGSTVASLTSDEQLVANVIGSAFPVTTYDSAIQALSAAGLQVSQATPLQIEAAAAGAPISIATASTVSAAVPNQVAQQTAAPVVGTGTVATVATVATTDYSSYFLYGGLALVALALFSSMGGKE